MARVYVTLVSVLLTASALLATVTQASRDTPTPLCSEVRGFAGEFNDRISIPVERSPLGKEAIVLVVRAFPLYLGVLSQSWIQVNATVHLAEGPVASVLSDENGMVVLRSVKAGTAIEVHVKRVRKDGPAPFRFWSYHANYPACHIDVSPTNSFFAPIPISVGELAAASSIYFKSVAPQGAKGFIATAIGGESPTIEVMDAPKKAIGIAQKLGEVIPWTDSTVFFSFSPRLTGERYVMLSMSILWTDSALEAPSTTGTGTGTGTTTTVSPNGGPVLTEAPKTDLKQEGKSGGRSVLAFLLVVLVCVLAYFVIVSAVNYRLKGMTTFPEMIPHIEFFRTLFQYCTLLQGSVRRGGSRGGYHDLNREEVSTENV